LNALPQRLVYFGNVNAPLLVEGLARRRPLPKIGQSFGGDLPTAPGAASSHGHLDLSRDRLVNRVCYPRRRRREDHRRAVSEDPARTTGAVQSFGASLSSGAKNLDVHSATLSGP
jgi:hypothetical protein